MRRDHARNREVRLRAHRRPTRVEDRTGRDPALPRQVLRLSMPGAAMNAHRKVRASETQRTVAAYLADNGWPYATDAGAGRQGSDILNTPGLGIEVKARRDLQPLAWVRQADNGSGLPLCVFRPDGMGPASIESWPVLMRLSDVVRLLRAAGYGDPEVLGADQ